MDEYVKAFRSGSKSLPESCDLTGICGRITRGKKETDFVRLSEDPNKRLSWIVDHDTLRSFLGKSHLELLISSGHSMEWVHHQLNSGKKFKLVVFSFGSAEKTNEEVKLATWDNILELMVRAYPEIDSTIWKTNKDELKSLTYEQIDPTGNNLKNYYLGKDSEHFLSDERFFALKEKPTLSQVRAFLHHQIGLNELFKGDGRTVQHDGVVTDNEYLTKNRRLDELPQCVLLDLNPIVPA
ncbi:hypothetical protein I4U23_016806 [Adineta vaga]|nr:hypothetical protein I4U23_016806 [Adineta vaga]